MQVAPQELSAQIGHSVSAGSERARTSVGGATDLHIYIQPSSAKIESSELSERFGLATQLAK